MNFLIKYLFIYRKIYKTIITFIIAAGCAAGTSVTGFAACKMLFLVFFNSLALNKFNLL